MLLHDSRELLNEVPSLRGPNPGGWLKEALPSSSTHPFGWAEMSPVGTGGLLKFTAPWEEEIGGSLPSPVLTKARMTDLELPRVLSLLWGAQRSG